VAALTERGLKDKAHQLMVKGQLELALEVFRQLITMNGKEPAYRLRHAEVSGRLGRTQAAVASYRVAAHLLTANGRIAQAKAALHTAIQLDPKDLNLRRAVKDLIRPPVVLGDSLDDDVTEPCLLPMLE
jgi:tetratricopeptide (TPR) repeat protein